MCIHKEGIHYHCQSEDLEAAEKVSLEKNLTMQLENNLRDSIILLEKNATLLQKFGNMSLDDANDIAQSNLNTSGHLDLSNIEQVEWGQPVEKLSRLVQDVESHAIDNTCIHLFLEQTIIILSEAI